MAKASPKAGRKRAGRRGSIGSRPHATAIRDAGQPWKPGPMFLGPLRPPCRRGSRPPCVSIEYRVGRCRRDQRCDRIPVEPGSRLEPVVGFEPTTDGLQNRCSTTELNWPEVAGPGRNSPGHACYYAHPKPRGKQFPPGRGLHRRMRSDPSGRSTGPRTGAAQAVNPAPSQTLHARRRRQPWSAGSVAETRRDSPRLAGSYVLGSVPRSVFVLQPASDAPEDGQVAFIPTRGGYR